MWGLVIGGITELAKGWFDVKKSKQQAEIAYNTKALQGEIDYDIEAMRASRHSYKDELIASIWFSPMYIGWYDPDTQGLRSVGSWIELIGGLPYWWQFGTFGIIAASFGLRWYFKNQNFKVADKKSA